MERAAVLALTLTVGAIGACGGGGGGSNGGPPGDDASTHDGSSETAAPEAGADASPVDAAPEAEAGPPDTLRAATRTTKPGITLVGTATSIGLIDSDATYQTVLAREFDYVTPENDMKWAPIEPQPNQWNWAPADQLVAYAQGHGMVVKGHALVWYQELPSWMSSMTDMTQIQQALVDHITTEVTHYKGQIRAWDVVNEAVLDDGSGFRPDVFYNALGPGYIKLAFKTAHAADPSAILNYNDYSAEGSGAKSDFVYKMLQDLLSTGTPVTGVGLQMHIDAAGYPKPADIAANMKRLGALGLHVNISEMDVRVADVAGTMAQKLAAEQVAYHDVVATCVAEPTCDAVTFWGFTDAHTWIDAYFGPNNYPCLFDTNYQKKPAYTGVFDAMLGQ